MANFDAEAFKSRTLRDALACVACPNLPRGDRVLAAALIADVCDHVDWTEALASDLLLTLRSCLDVPSAVEDIVDVLRRKVRDKTKLTAPLARFGRTAHEQHAFGGLNVLTRAMLDEAAWADAVDPAWVEAVTSWGQGQARAQMIVGPLLALWVPLRGARYEWLRRLVEHTPALLSNQWLPFTARQELHFAAPTAWGWRHFAFHGAPDLQPWTAQAFGDQASKAVTTLKAAIAESQAAADGVAVLVMSGWLVELMDEA